MSRALPERPNLDHLKKQAKDLLPELQAAKRGARLADAQHAIATSYGFASWPKLKDHVIALTSASFAGSWTADLERSRRHPANQFRSASLRIREEGGSITIVDTFVLDSGDTHRGENVVIPDGATRATSRDGYLMTASRYSPTAIDVIVMHDGREEGRVRYELIDEGRQLVMTDGTGDMRIVFKRQ